MGVALAIGMGPESPRASSTGGAIGPPALSLVVAVAAPGFVWVLAGLAPVRPVSASAFHPTLRDLAALAPIVGVEAFCQSQGSGPEDRCASFSVREGEAGVVRSTSSMIGGNGVGDGALATCLMLDSSSGFSGAVSGGCPRPAGVTGGNAIGPAKCGSNLGSASARRSKSGRAVRERLIFEAERCRNEIPVWVVRQRLSIVSQPRRGIPYQRFLP